VINQLRAVLLERGIAVPQGRCKLEAYLGIFMADEHVALSPRIRTLVEDLRAEWSELDRRISDYETEFAMRARADETTSLLTTIPGIGP